MKISNSEIMETSQHQVPGFELNINKSLLLFLEVHLLFNSVWVFDHQMLWYKSVILATSDGFHVNLKHSFCQA